MPDLRRLRRAARAPGRAWTAARRLTEASRLNGAGALPTALRAAALRRSHGYAIEEAAALGLFAPGGQAAADAYVSKRRTLAAQTRLNPPAMVWLTENKAVFAIFCAAAGLPTPPLLGTIEGTRAWPAGGARLDGEAAVAAWLAGDALPRAYVVKPLQGYHGIGVRIVSRSGGRLSIRGAAGPQDPREVARALAGDPIDGGHLVQGLVSNDPRIEELFGGAAVHTIRIVTLAGDRDVRILNAYLRASVSPRGTDNYGDGSSGTSVCEIGPDGRIRAVRARPAGGYGMVDIDPLPATGRRVVGEPVPRWDEARALAVRAAATLRAIPTIGWDVAITPNGPILIEANSRWDPPPFSNIREGLAALGSAG